MAELIVWLPTLAGLLHFAQLPAMFIARRVLDWQGELARLAPINRRIIGVIGGGIVLVIIGLGLLVVALHGRLLQSPAGVGLCVFLCVFWAYRGAVQLFVYAQLWPHQQRWSHHALNLLFATLTMSYGLSAIASSS
jgi:hypothetical protein